MTDIEQERGLPSFEECYDANQANLRGNGPSLTALQRFIFENEPYNEDGFRSGLQAVLDEARAQQPSAEPVAFVDERAISWLEQRRMKASAHITTKLSAVKSMERPMPLYARPAADVLADAARWRELAYRFDHTKSSESRRILDDFGFMLADEIKPLSEAVDAAIAARTKGGDQNG